MAAGDSIFRTVKIFLLDIDLEEEKNQGIEWDGEDDQPLSTPSDGITVEASHSTGKKRDYSKFQACYFCSKSVHKMARHLEIAHKNIREIADLPKVSRDPEDREKRSKTLTKFRNLGNFSHNVSVLLNKSGSLYVGKRPHSKSAIAEDFLPCLNCLAFFMKKDLWRHYKTCKFRDEKINYKKEQETRFATDCLKAGTDLLNGALGSRYFMADDNTFTDTVLDKFHQDKVSRCIKSDDLLLLYGKSQLKRLGRQRAGQVREKLRIRGRLKINLRSLSGEESSSISEFIAPSKFDLCVRAIQNLAVESVQQSLTGSNTYRKPTLALKAGQYLKRVAGIKKGQAIRDQDLTKKTDAEEFISLYNDEYHETISSIAHQTMSERRFNNKTVLPLTEDLLKYVAYLEKNMTEKTRILKENQMLGDFQALAEFTLARILMFNKRRASEASRLLISQYCTRPDWGIKNSEMVAALQPIERHLMKHMNLVEVLGKKGRRVPVLMTVSMTNAVQALIENRPAGIKSVNPHVFPQGDFKHMRGSDVIRKTVLAADLKEPTLITTTSLRKYLATVSQIFGLTTKDLEELARHMGHELSVHKQFYRLQDDIIEMAKISRLLIAVEEGKVAQFKNKQLDDISLEDIVLEEENEEQGEWDGEDELNQGKSIDTIQGAPDSVPVPPLSDGSDIDLEEEKNQGIEWDGEDDQPLSTPSDDKSKMVKRTVWTKVEKYFIKLHLMPLIKQTSKPPQKNDVLRAMAASKGELKHRNWKSVKYQAWSMFQQDKKKENLVLKTILQN